MKFFTDKTVENPYLLIKIKDYIKMREKKPERLEKYKEVFIDPGVYELTKNPCYSWELDINVNDFLDSLPENHYFSFDYPCDMNLKYQELFLEKSWNNATQYHNHPQYIVTVQSEFKHYWNFVEWFNKYNELNVKSGILALGNICRFRSLNQYLKHILDYTFRFTNHPRIHIYGLNLRSIPYAEKLAKRFNIKLSIDNTKWTRACTQELKNKNGINCNSQNRKEFFNEYIKRIESLGVKLE